MWMGKVRLLHKFQPGYKITKFLKTKINGWKTVRFSWLARPPFPCVNPSINFEVGQNQFIFGIPCFFWPDWLQQRTTMAVSQKLRIAKKVNKLGAFFHASAVSTTILVRLIWGQSYVGCTKFRYMNMIHLVGDLKINVLSTLLSRTCGLRTR